MRLTWLLALGMLIPAAGHTATKVSMTNGLAFEPQIVRVQPGEAVTWVNDSLLVHTVTAVPRLAARPEHVSLPQGARPFDSGRIQPDESYTHRFQVPGRYRYFCIPHEGASMVGTVIVREQSPPP